MDPADAAKFLLIYQILDDESVKDGSIPGSKVVDVIRIFGQNPTEVEGKKLLLELDVNGDMQVSFRELCAYFASKKMKLTVSDEAGKRLHLMKLMESFDENSDRKISKRELKNLLTHMGQPLDKRELDDAFKGLDMDGDGTLSFDELLAGLEA